MSRVIVTTDTSPVPPGASVLLDEQVYPIHLSNRHGAAQLVERIAWAVTDAEKAQGSGAETEQEREWPLDTRPVRTRPASTRRRRRPNANVRATQQYTSGNVGA
ncbi:MAG TPA: hypothetical protein VHT27_10415 [Solirubrobacteraceae bacterium]|jgi:hypothetical protein|nr:hypothetical protein [Solirubrobacteraceae bacterium]